MLFHSLRPSSALSLQAYEDFDQFRESERYARAESVPLSTKDFSVRRATLPLPSATLSLVRTFPRIINGYDFSGRSVIVIPMDGVSSARLNGEDVDQSVIVFNGRSNCTVVEPERRLVAILSIAPDAPGFRGLEWANSYRLLRSSPERLACLQRLVFGMFSLGADDSIVLSNLAASMQATLLSAFHELAGTATMSGRNSVSLASYKTMVDQVNRQLGLDPLNATNAQLAEEIGVSVRTLQTATQSICGLAIHRYSRLLRLLSVRRQLGTGAPGLTVKASALAHGFWHLSQFSHAYCQTFGEAPSATLAAARLGSSRSLSEMNLLSAMQAA